MSAPSAQKPILISLGLVVAGLIVAAIGGITEGSIFGGLVAGAGLFPAMYAAWAGMQQETQASLAQAISMVVLSMAVGGILIVLALVDKIF